MRKFILAAMLLTAPAFAQSVPERTGVNSALGVSPSTVDFVKQVRSTSRWHRT